MCGSDSKIRLHLYLHCSTANFLWNMLFGIFVESWMFPMDMHQFLLTNLEVLVKEAKFLYGTLLMLLFSVFGWNLEWNGRIFNDSFSTLGFIGIMVCLLAPFSTLPMDLLVVFFNWTCKAVRMLCCIALAHRSVLFHFCFVFEDASSTSFSLFPSLIVISFIIKKTLRFFLLIMLSTATSFEIYGELHV